MLRLLCLAKLGGQWPLVQDVVARANVPSSFDCVELDTTGNSTVINGPEGLLIQSTYGPQLFRAYNSDCLQ